MVEVKLTAAELLQAGAVGLLRQIESLQAGHKVAHGADPEKGWLIHVEGALGELAAAKVMGCYNGLSSGTFKAPDLGGDTHVRTRSRHDYDLIVRDGDADDGWFVLVTGCNGTYRVWGAIKGRDAKQAKWRKDHGGRDPAFFVPKAALTWQFERRGR